MVTTRGTKRALSERNANIPSSQLKAKIAKRVTDDKENRKEHGYASMERDELAKLCRDRDLRCGGRKVQLIEYSNRHLRHDIRG